MANKKPRKQKRAHQPNNAEWREFEKFVARVEGIVAPIGAVVTSPEKVRDFRGRLRQVDATIRYQIGTVPILIVVECRKRSRRQDVEWIEQLATKRRSLGAAKTIAVSSKGLSVAAIEVAREEGIETRVMADVDPETVRNWVSIQSMNVYRMDWRITRMHLEFYAPNIDETMLAAVHQELRSLEQKNVGIFLRSKDSKLCSPKDLAEEFQESDVFRDVTVPIDGNTHPLGVAVRYPVGYLSVVSKVGSFPIREIRFDLEIRPVDVSKPLTPRFGNYQDANGTIFHAAEWSMPIEKHELALSFQKSSGGGVSSALTLLNADTGVLQVISVNGGLQRSEAK